MKAKANSKTKLKNCLELKAPHKGMLQLEYQQAVNYALMSNGTKVLQSSILENQEDQPWREVHIKVSGQYIVSSECILDTLQAGHAMQLDTLKLVPDNDTLQCLTEAIQTSFSLSVRVGDEEAEEFVLPIELQPFDQWNGNHAATQLLTSFITPNHPYVQQLCRTAADQMQSWTGDASMNAYQNEDPNEVRQQVAAVYEALRKESIAYVEPPASFGEAGQRVRMADIIRRTKMATCLDSTLLMASCLEQLGIHPIVIMMKTHAFVGAWLTEQIYNRAVGYDRERLLKSAADGVGQLVLVETTYICHTHQCNFEQAAEYALNELRDGADDFLYFLDVKHCRLEHYRPIPQLMKEDGEWMMAPTVYENLPSDQGAKEQQYFDIDFDDSQRSIPSRLSIWERKLLDLTMANRLLHIRPGMHCVPLITLDTPNLIEKLYTKGESYCLVENPTDKQVDVFRCGSIDTQFYKEDLLPFVTNGLSEHKLYTYIDNESLDSQLKNITRQAKINLEESGATSLFLTVGLLHWQDNEEEGEQKSGWRRRRTKTDHCAPILLLPVEIIQRQGGTGYSIHATEDPLIFNITIFELLKQRFGIDMTQVLNLAATDGGQNDQAIDNDIALTIQRAFAAIRLALADRQGWNVHEECTLGLYSFLKFVMWNDIHQYAQQLQESPVVNSLIKNCLLLNDIPDADARKLDETKAPHDFALPIDVDSSQLEAIADAGEGKSFLLYGPPGTGKSQTITNMIANAMYQGKRVLFVAQKMAALDVVQNRLERIGLAPFCLELHSNKATKSHVLQQFDQTLQMAEKQVNTPGFLKMSEALFNRRKELICYMESLHRRQAGGRSLYDCISGYMAIDGAEIALPLSLAQSMEETTLDEVRGQLEMLNAVFRVTGHPADHPLLGLESYSAQADHLDSIFAKLDQLADSVGKQGYNYPPDLKLLETYPDDMLQQYNEVEGAFFLLRSFRRNAVLKELRLINPNLQWEDIPAICQKMKQAQALRNQMHELDQLAHIDWPADGQSLLAAIARWRAHRQQARTWCQWTLRRKELADKGLTPVINWLIANHASGSVTADAFHKGVLLQLAQHIIATDSQLSLFNGMIFDETIESYRGLAKEFQDLTREELKIRLAQRIVRLLEPTQPAEIKEELTFLKKNIANRGRGVSIRHIISKIQHILPDLCPCMLMSPISVAQYISLDKGISLMDLVIFDEASQIPTNEAVGAIARGKAVVIVGDPRQMPPTAFFQANAVSEDEAQYDDMDSILDDCIALSMPSHYLTWHYRSRHESLISFSNANYYEGKLMTFPSSDDRASHVEFIAVEGIYDKGASRSNRNEAEAIVEEIVRHYSSNDDKRLSLGVISFSKVQQTLIEDMLQEHLKGHPSLEKRINEGEEPLFIKNLENVQGDERDIILFSVGYGPDKNGNVSVNFGPLNISGGERRLNVAVSRARQRMKVFSTMHAEQIDLSHSQALGVAGLKSFLYFAEHGYQPDFASQQRGQNFVGGLPELIADRLRAMGYQVDTYVGRSSFRVDIAVVNPKDPDQYSMGILCDGKNYYATPTARDREIVQPSVLKGLGWHIERIWSVDWLENPDIVIERLTEKLKELA